MKAKEIMKSPVITIKPDTTIETIAKILTDHDISGVPVVDEDNNLIGIVTEGDLLHKETNPRMPGVLSILGAFIYFNGVDRYKDDFRKLAATKASEIMTKKVISVSENAEITDIAAIMTTHKINRVPVLRNNKILGIVSRADIIKTLVK